MTKITKETKSQVSVKGMLRGAVTVGFGVGILCGTGHLYDESRGTGLDEAALWTGCLATVTFIMRGSRTFAQHSGSSLLKGTFGVNRRE